MHKFKSGEAKEVITDSEKKKIRKDLLYEAKYYYKYLLNKIFYVILDDNKTSFQVLFDKKRFLHLTGVCTNLSAEDFFDLCLGKKENNNTRYIQLSEFFTTTVHTKAAESEKHEVFDKMHLLFTENLIVGFDVTTTSRVYKLGLIDINLSLFCNQYGSYAYTPVSLRKNSYVQKSKEQLRPLCIFVKEVNNQKYTMYTYPKYIDDNVKIIIKNDLQNIDIDNIYHIDLK